MSAALQNISTVQSSALKSGQHSFEIFLRQAHNLIGDKGFCGSTAKFVDEVVAHARKKGYEFTAQCVTNLKRVVHTLLSRRGTEFGIEMRRDPNVDTAVRISRVPTPAVA